MSAQFFPQSWSMTSHIPSECGFLTTCSSSWRLFQKSVTVLSHHHGNLCNRLTAGASLRLWQYKMLFQRVAPKLILRGTMTMEAVNERPLVSVILAVFNEAGYITKCMTSLLEQETPDFDLEILAVDGGSTDST